MALTDDPLSQAEAAERTDVSGAQQIVGEHAVTTEQTGYEQDIAAQPKPPLAAAPAPTDESSDPEGDAARGLGEGTQQVLRSRAPRQHRK